MSGLSQQQLDNMLKYLKALDYLHKKDLSALRSILTMVKEEADEEVAKFVKRHQDLAKPMVNEDEFYSEVIRLAKVLVQNTETLQVFLQMIGEEPEPPIAPVKKYMRQVAKECIHRPKSTLSDVLKFEQIADEEKRYFFVLDDNNSLKGIISINDIAKNISVVRSLPKDTLAISLEFFNNNPSVVFENDTMSNAEKKFLEAKERGHPITKLIIVADNKRLVGLVGQADINRWLLSQS